MIDAVHHGSILESKGIQLVNAPQINAILLWIRAPLMMSIDTAATTEIMFGGMGIELITAGELCAAHQLEISQGYRGYRRTTAATQGAISTANIVHSFGKSERQLNPATMATGNIVSLSHDNPCNPD